jgi:hypothetical protein
VLHFVYPNAKHCLHLQVEPLTAIPHYPHTINRWLYFKSHIQDWTANVLCCGLQTPLSGLRQHWYSCIPVWAVLVRLLCILSTSQGDGAWKLMYDKVSMVRIYTCENCAEKWNSKLPNYQFAVPNSLHIIYWCILRQVAQLNSQHNFSLILK